ncbi:hypothetical protein Tco_1428259 [Tanacetum coccineum]
MGSSSFLPRLVFCSRIVHDIAFHSGLSRVLETASLDTARSAYYRFLPGKVVHNDEATLIRSPSLLKLLFRLRGPSGTGGPYILSSLRIARNSFRIDQVPPALGECLPPMVTIWSGKRGLTNYLLGSQSNASKHELPLMTLRPHRPALRGILRPLLLLSVLDTVFVVDTPVPGDNHSIISGLPVPSNGFATVLCGRCSCVSVASISLGHFVKESNESTGTGIPIVALPEIFSELFRPSRSSLPAEGNDQR